MTAKVATCLWFNDQAEEAATLYVPNGPVLIVEFTLGGAPYQALNGGPMYAFTEAASISVRTKDQAETDRLWDALTANGGSEGRCAWLKDRFGLSWQIVPEALPRLLSDPNRDAASRVMQAMLGMRKIDIKQLEVAHRGP
jgi:predicted 3-demethylubiquinone-9 3-methyltransferase (glyoxalase superfamily)